jgi:hypothetical protein
MNFITQKIKEDTISLISVLPKSLPFSDVWHHLWNSVSLLEFTPFQLFTSWPPYLQARIRLRSKVQLHPKKACK